MRPSALIFFILVLLGAACASDSGNKSETGNDNIIKEYREDGTLSSAKQVDSEGYMHGVKVSYYEDGRTVHSKISYQHGRKHGAAEWYFKNGTVGERTNFHYGRREGLTRRYHENGKIREEIEYVQGTEVPGSKKEYDLRGILKK